MRLDRAKRARALAGLLVAVGTLVTSAPFAGASSGGSSDTGCAGAPAAGDYPLTVRVGGLGRSVLLHVPRGLPASQRVPLVLALHGYGGSGEKMASYSGFSRVADQYHFLVSYPSSDGVAWNSTGAGRGPADIEFLGHTIADLIQNDCADPHRVFAAGVSNGGGMVALAACELSKEIAAVAPVAGDYSRQPPCHPQRPVSVLEIHGTADQVVPYFGQGAARTKDGLPSFVNGWVARNGCAGSPEVRRLATRTTLFAWGECAGATRVEHIRITAGKHQWPGAHPPDPGPPATICAACTIWSFFSALDTEDRVWPASGGAGTGAG